MDQILGGLGLCAAGLVIGALANSFIPKCIGKPQNGTHRACRCCCQPRTGSRSRTTPTVAGTSLRRSC